MGIKHVFVSGKTDGADETLVRPSNWNAEHVIDSEVTIPVFASPATPSANFFSFFGKALGGRVMPAFIGPSGQDATMQPHIGRNKPFLVIPQPAVTTISNIGPGITAVGTATAATVNATNLHTSMARVDYLVTTAATSAIAGYRSTGSNTFFRGNGTPYVGGFTHVARVAPATGGTVATRRFFCGMTGTTGGVSPTDVNPSTLTNIVGAGYDAADTTWQIFFNDASGTATKVNTGIARPSVDRSTPCEVAIFTPPNGTAISVTLTQLSDNLSFTASESVDIPIIDTLLSPRAYHSVGGTSSVVGLTLFSLYIETDN